MAAATKARPAARKTGRSSRKGRRAKSRRRALMRTGPSSPVHRREPWQELGPRRQPLVESRIGVEEASRKVLRRHWKQFRRQVLAGRRVVQVNGRQPLPLQLLRVIGERKAQLLVVPLFAGLRRALSEENGSLAARDDEDERPGAAVDERVVAIGSRGEVRREALEEDETRGRERPDPHPLLLERRLDRAERVGRGGGDEKPLLLGGGSHLQEDDLQLRGQARQELLQLPDDHFAGRLRRAGQRVE